MFQKTIKKEVKIKGVGLHTGKNITLTLKPADIDCGITFVRTDVKGGAVIKISPATVVDTRLATTIGYNGLKIAVVEHLLAAIKGLGIDNIIVEIDAEEVPNFDGSAHFITSSLKEAGIKVQNAEKMCIVIDEPVIVTDGEKVASFFPSNLFKISFSISFPHPMIKDQKMTYFPDDMQFDTEISPARTFGFLKDIEYFRAAGLIKGGSLDNAIIMTDDGILNEDGLRFPDEFVRHKILDVIGDIAVIGLPVKGHYVGNKSGHSLNYKLVRKIFSETYKWHIASFSEVNVPQRGGNIHLSSVRNQQIAVSN